MALGERLAVLPWQRRVTHINTGSTRALWRSCAVSLAGYGALFLVLHIRAIGWAPGQVLDPFTGYWQWVYTFLISEDRVMAARRSALAASNPLIFLLALLPIGIGYVGTLAQVRRLPDARQPGLGRLTALAVVFSVPLLLLPNLLSADVYSYISFGRVGAVLGGNPFVDPPNTYPNDLYLTWVNWRAVPSVYGPPWIYLSMGLTLLVERVWSHPIAYVLAYKLLALLLHLANGVLVWSILARLDPRRQHWATALYLLNPLALIEFAGNGHNDVLMLTLLLGGVWLHLRDRWALAVVAFTLATLTKWIALPALPLYGLVLLWRPVGIRVRAGYLASVIGIFAVSTTLMYAPYWQGPATLAVLIDAPPQKLQVNSLGDMVVTEIQYGMYELGYWPHPSSGAWPLLRVNVQEDRREADEEDRVRSGWRYQQQVMLQRYNQAQQQRVTTILRAEQRLDVIVRYVGIALVLTTCLVGAAYTRNLRTMLAALAWIFFVYTTIGAVWVWPWYATWFVALAALLDWRVAGRAAILLSLLALLIYPLYPQPEAQLIFRLRALIVFGPPVVFAAYYGQRWVRGLIRRPTTDH